MVEINGVKVASIDNTTADKIEVTAAAVQIGQDQTGTVLIPLKNGHTTESAAKSDGSFIKQFGYKLAGAITDVTPVQGQEDATVTISGTTMLGQGNPVFSVTVAAKLASADRVGVVLGAAASAAARRLQ